MKIKIKIIKTLASIAVLAIASNSALAANTTADTSINNRATISYKVSGATQDPINSSPGGNSDPTACTDAMPATGVAPGAGVCATTFKVDKKIDLLVTGTGTSVNVSPSQAINTTGTGPTTEISYLVKNEGNSDEYFTLTPTDVALSDFNSTDCVVTTPTAATTYLILKDATLAVKVQCNIPDASATVIAAAVSQVELLATAVTSAAGTTVYADSGATVELAGTVDIVLADDTGGVADTGARNASHSGVSSYVISTAALTVKKEATVVYDPSNGTTNPKRIPGAVIKYVITVTNSGPQPATDVVITDALDASVLYETSAALSAAACTGAITTPASTFTCAELVTGTVSSDATGITVPASGGVATMTFFVEIQ